MLRWWPHGLLIFAVIPHHSQMWTSLWSEARARVRPTSPPVLTAHQRRHRSSRCVRRMTCSCPMTPCGSPSCWQLGWQSPPRGLCSRQNAEKGLDGKALYAHIPARAACGCCTHGGPDDFTESRSILLSCLAFSLASAFSSFLAFTIWGKRKCESTSSAKAPKTQLQEKRGLSVPRAWKEWKAEGS